MSRNTGNAFLIFSDERIVKDFKHFGAKLFHKLIHEKLDPSTVDKLQMKRWVFSSAMPQSDIIWSGLTADSLASLAKTVFLYIALLLISVVLITPVTLI